MALSAQCAKALLSLGYKKVETRTEKAECYFIRQHDKDVYIFIKKNGALRYANTPNITESYAISSWGRTQLLTKAAFVEQSLLEYRDKQQESAWTRARWDMTYDMMYDNTYGF